MHERAFHTTGPNRVLDGIKRDTDPVCILIVQDAK